MSNKRAMTPWFPQGIKPVRKGRYKTRCKDWWGSSTFYDVWNGKMWVTGDSGHPIQASQMIEWRGLAEKPR